jgi:DNA-binding MarR family transcriptional regulator
MKQPDRLVETLRDTVIGMVRQEAADLTARQLAVLLVCCLDEPPHTGTILMRVLSISKPAISRAVDTLEQMALLKRREDKRDRRVVLLSVTPSGRAFVAGLGAMMQAAADRHASAGPPARSTAHPAPP